MLNVNQMILSAEACLGWPYVSPGTNDENGIDCSGLFVKIFKDQGEKIAHGSNTIWRKYCTEKGKIETTGQLCPGMAVFKWNPNTPKKFDDNLGDFQHIGLVVSVKPLRIIHATTAGKGVVTTDTRIGKWAYWGKLKNVNYGEEVVVSVEYMYVNTATGSLNMRSQATSGASIVTRIPKGEKVAVIENENGWCKVIYNGKTGYVMASFLTRTAPDDKLTFTITKECATTLYEALKYSLKL